MNGNKNKFKLKSMDGSYLQKGDCMRGWRGGMKRAERNESNAIECENNPYHYLVNSQMGEGET